MQEKLTEDKGYFLRCRQPWLGLTTSKSTWNWSIKHIERFLQFWEWILSWKQWKYNFFWKHSDFSLQNATLIFFWNMSRKQSNSLSWFWIFLKIRLKNPKIKPQNFDFSSFLPWEHWWNERIETTTKERSQITNDCSQVKNFDHILFLPVFVQKRCSHFPREES